MSHREHGPDEEYTPSTGDISYLEREMEIEEAAIEVGMSSNDDELLMLLSMSPDQYCQVHG